MWNLSAWCLALLPIAPMWWGSFSVISGKLQNCRLIYPEDLCLALFFFLSLFLSHVFFFLYLNVWQGTELLIRVQHQLIIIIFFKFFGTLINCYQDVDRGVGVGEGQRRTKKREEAGSICTKEPSTLLLGTWKLVTFAREWGSTGVQAEDLLLTRVHRTVCDMEECYCLGTARHQ